MTDDLSGLLHELDDAVAGARTAEVEAEAANAAAEAANAAYAAAADRVRALHAKVADNLGTLLDTRVRVGGAPHVTGL